MTKRKKKVNIQKTENLSLDGLDNQMAELSMKKGALLDSQLKSNNLEDVVKAQKYLNNLNSNNQKIDPKSFFWTPDDYGSGTRTKEPYKAASFDVLQRMGDIFIIKDIINTRVEQIQRFLSFTLDDQREGYTIRKRVDILDGGNQKKTKNQVQGDKKIIKSIRDYLENGGFGTKWDDADDLSDFVRKIVRDSLSMDQLAFECIRNRRGELVKHNVIDASLIRILDSQDPKFQKEWEPYMINGHYPKYGQVWSGNIHKNPKTGEPVVFYPWELGYGVRNKNSNIRNNGYGVSETETLMEIITWVLWGMQYNGNFFKNGSQPKGFVNIKEAGGANNNTLSEFKNNWTQMMKGVENCLSGDTFIITPEGRLNLEDFFKDDDEDKKTKIWTGKKFEDALVYKSGKKVLNRISLNNGMSIDSSPDHRFKTVSEEGDIVWKKRSDLKVGDYLMINKKTVDYNISVINVNEKEHFSFEKIINLEEFDKKVPMYDVQIFDDFNQFIANGILTHNSHKTPIFQGIDLEWISMQESNKDMEFHGWLEFLLVVSCSTFTIDPSELGFNFKNQAQSFGQDGQHERLDHSKKKGLIPLLRFLEKIINKFLVSELATDYEFVFTGIDIEDAKTQVELVDSKLKAGTISFEDAFERENGRAYDAKKDTILNPIMLQYKQMEQSGGDFMNDVAEGGEDAQIDDGSQNTFDQFGKAENLLKGDTPYSKLLKNYVSKTLGDEK